MNRREAIRTTVGALFGASVIPVVVEKPRINLPILKEFPAGMGFNFKSVTYSYQAAHNPHIPFYVPLPPSNRTA